MVKVTAKKNIFCKYLGLNVSERKLDTGEYVNKAWYKTCIYRIIHRIIVLHIS